VRISAGNLAPTGVSRASECVTIVREAVREGSSKVLLFTISVESAGHRREWSLLMVTATGHWLDTWLDGALRAMLRVQDFADRWWIPKWIPADPLLNR
jgi:hypothetical protein